MKKIFLATVIWLCALPVLAESHLITPVNQHESAFAIVIDRQSFEQANEAVLAYRDMLETDQLSTYILVGEWERPTPLRLEIKALHETDPRLEGVVFVGDIPVAMVRQAQHMTTAFKMDEEAFPRQRSSVASDRFYDDFDLEFEYIGPDEDHRLWHYYRLLPTSAQALHSDIYSGRILPLQNGTDPYQQISDYLFKVVEDRRQQNQVGHLFSYLGHVYNSECMIAWASEKIALYEQFPYLNSPGHSLKYMSFNMLNGIKTHVINELQRPELDIALMHKHGSIGVQHLSTTLPTADTRVMVRRLQESIHSLRQAEISDELRERRIAWLGIPESWVEHTVLPEDFEPQTSTREDNELYVHEVLEMVPGPRFIMLDACYNGSFHHPENIAGAYIFNDGNTIATTGNTVNVLQDNWPNQFIGLLGEGVRLGHIRRPVQTLENHIVGDPTFRFAPRAVQDLNLFIARNQTRTEAWKGLLSSDNPDLVAFSLRMMSQNEPEDFSHILFDIFGHSPYSTVRMEALHLLRNINDELYHEALKVAVTDSYELVRRLGASWMEDVGLPEFIPYLLDFLIHDPYYIRASSYVVPRTLGIFPKEMVKEALEERLAAVENLFGKEEAREAILNALQRYWNMADGRHEIMFNAEAELEDRKNAIRFLRNNNYYHYTDQYLAFAGDSREEEILRVMMIEALGWFTHAYNKEEIIQACRDIYQDESHPISVRMEALKTARRLIEA